MNERGAERSTWPDTTWQGEARALLRLAALREEIPVERARAFAAAVPGESDVGRWALAVLRGEPTAARALVELAVAHLARPSGQRDAVRGVKGIAGSRLPTPGQCWAPGPPHQDTSKRSRVGASPDAVVSTMSALFSVSIGYSIQAGTKLLLSPGIRYLTTELAEHGHAMAAIVPLECQTDPSCSEIVTQGRDDGVVLQLAFGCGFGF